MNKRGKYEIACPNRIGIHDYEQVRTYFPYTLLLAREVVAWGGTAQVLVEANLRRAVEVAQHWHERAPVCHVNGEDA